MGQIVSEGEARSVEAPYLGFCDASTSTTVEYVNLTTWAGSYVTITVETEAHYISFGSATGFTMDKDAATLGTASVAFPVVLGEKFSCVVDPDTPWLGYCTIANTGIIRVHKS